MYSIRCHHLVRGILSSNLGKYQITSIAAFKTSHRRNNSHYEILGINKLSTQNEIKSAYYKLSMQYHPDKNQGCDDAAKKFREITQAYEVLGNYKLRRLYDKGVGKDYDTTSPFAKEAHDISETEDDAQTRFYKSRFKKSSVANAQGRTPIYDFDEWSRAHYGQNFERKKAAKEKFERVQKQKVENAASQQHEIVLLAFLFCSLLIYFVFIAESSLDMPKNLSKRTAEKKEEASSKQKSGESS